MKRTIHKVNDGIDKLHEAEQLVELVYLAGTHCTTTEPFSVAALSIAALLKEALVHLEAASVALNGERDAA